VVNELPALLWAVNLGSIELHTSLHERQELIRPTVLAFDLDPGEGVRRGADARPGAGRTARAAGVNARSQKN
jgi:DNA primase